MAAVAFGIDYEFGPPSIAAFKKAGVKFACRYLSHYPTKNLTKSEAKLLSDAGIEIVVVWEDSASRALGGYAVGRADAQAALALARAIGMPENRPIYFAVDWDASPSQQDAINAYLDGAASALGRARVGIYGGYGPVSRAMGGGKAAWGWQTYAWSSGDWCKGIHIRQYSNDHIIGGVSCDYDDAMQNDYGQWRVGASPVQEEDVQDSGQVPSRKNVPNGYAAENFVFKPGSFGTVYLSCDFTWNDPANGYEPQDPPVVRAAAHQKGRTGHVLMDPTAGSPTHGTEHITIGVKDGHGWSDVVPLTVPAGTDYVSIVRIDHGDLPVGVCLA